ncbi:hypothetical protein Bbelb_406950 [Branchiostoma belcheri]|nr:hypothetical protein Bbelb_406950 [Branchiostoma belcheri]
MNKRENENEGGHGENMRGEEGGELKTDVEQDGGDRSVWALIIGQDETLNVLPLQVPKAALGGGILGCTSEIENYGNKKIHLKTRRDWLHSRAAEIVDLVFALDIRIGKGVSLQKVATVLKCRHEGCDRMYVRPKARVTHELKKHNLVVNETVESSSDTSKEHYVFNYHNAKLGMSLLLTNIQDVTKEGGGKRVARYFRMAHSLLWNRFVNTRGGENIAGDLRLEHMNNLLKSFLKRRKRLDRLGTLAQQEHGSGHSRFGIKLWVLADSTNGYISRTCSKWLGLQATVDGLRRERQRDQKGWREARGQNHRFIACWITRPSQLDIQPGEPVSGHIAPEVAAGGPVSVYSDIFSLGRLRYKVVRDANNKSGSGRVTCQFYEDPRPPTSNRATRAQRGWPRRHGADVDAMRREFAAFKEEKASGPDEVPNWILSEFADDLAPIVTHLFNASYEEGTVPIDWKSANVVPVPKFAGASKAQDMRPVSLLSVLAKLLERSILKRLLPSIQAVIKDQYAYVKGSSTTLALVRMVQTWLTAVDSNKPTLVIAIFADMSKAFDRVDHARLLQCVIDIHTSPRMQRWIVSYLQNRRQRVVIDGETSSWRTLTSGVPQGGVLSPYLFILFMSTRTTLIRTTVEDESSHLNSWAEDNKMTLNGGKSLLLQICFSRSVPIPPTITLGGQPVPSVDCAKGLGFLIDKDLTFNEQVNSMISNASRRLHYLHLLTKQGTSVTDLIQIYLALVRPVLEYGHVLLVGCSKEQELAIERVQRRALRIISLGGRRSVPDLPTLKSRREDAAVHLFQRMLQENHPLHDLVPPSRGNGLQVRGFSARRTKLCRPPQKSGAPAHRHEGTTDEMLVPYVPEKLQRGQHESISADDFLFNWGPRWASDSGSIDPAGDNHVAVGMTSILEEHLGVSLPRQDILNGYLLFEVLCQHQYDYSCMEAENGKLCTQDNIEPSVLWVWHTGRSTLNTTGPTSIIEEQSAMSPPPEAMQDSLKNPVWRRWRLTTIRCHVPESCGYVASSVGTRKATTSMCPQQSKIGLKHRSCSWDHFECQTPLQFEKVFPGKWRKDDDQVRNKARLLLYLGLVYMDLKTAIRYIKRIGKTKIDNSTLPYDEYFPVCL